MLDKRYLENTIPPNRNGKQIKTTIGPVSNLEQHVQPDWWQNIFNSLYLKTDADVVQDPDITRDEIAICLDLLQLKKDDHILDLCCGQGRHSIELASRGYNVEGLDRSRFLIQKAKTIAKKQGLNIKFKEGDARKLYFPTDSFDAVIIMGNSFGYFETIQDDIKVLKEVFRVLKPWGKLLIEVANGDYLKKHFQARSWEWINNKLFVCRERSLSIDTQRLISREVITDVDKGVIADQFYAERLYNQDELYNLLSEAGFSNIAYHGEIELQSKKNQDLGMMEKCIILSSQVKKEWAPVKRKAKKNIKQIVTLLGDPEKPDPLKPFAIFDDDDFYTIDSLKDALRTLSNYQFNYLTNHETLINDLKKLKHKIHFVFNLCDEGYNNEARKELHVPALLEVLDIPFTGSSTQCLAYCYDKSLVRGIAKEMAIATPEAFMIISEDSTYDIAFPFPVIVKPNFGDSSFGITQRSVAYNHDQLISSISEIRQKFGYDKPILVEEFLTGKDISLGIIGNPYLNYTILPIIEEDYSKLPEDLPKICGYEAKWQPDSPYGKIESIPVQLPDKSKNYIEESCLKLFERLECRDYSRFDWRLDANGNPKLLEVNPNPGWCWDGHLAKMAAFADINYSNMLQLILQAAEERIEFTNHKSL